MKNHIFLFLLSTTLFAHPGHHPAHHEHGSEEQAHVGAVGAVLGGIWNLFEVGNHAAAIFGYGVSDCCCGQGVTKSWHLIEVLGHGTNLIEGISDYLQNNMTPTTMRLLSLAFNLMGATAQAQTILSRDYKHHRFLLSLIPMSGIDVVGHSMNAYQDLKALWQNAF